MAETTTGHNVAFGGGGFLMEPENPLLDDFVLQLARRHPARVCFIPTAMGDSANYVARFYRALSRKCISIDLTLFGSAALARHPARTEDLAAFVAEQDVFYVGGGNTANMLAIWRAHGLDRLLGDAWRSGAVLSGVSAGMNCWFQASVTDSFGDFKALQDGLGLLDGSACPHYDGEPERRATHHRLIGAGFPAGYAADDGAALHFAGSTLTEVVSSRRAAAAYRVERRGAEVVEERLPTRFLGAGPQSPT
jgi:peptidase E